MNSFTSGAIATALAELVTSPICLVRTRQINGEEKNIIKIATDLYKQQGIRGFYSASLPAVMSQILSTSLKYGIYSNFKADSLQDKMRNGALGGAFTATITTPIDVIRVNMQMGPLQIMKQPLSFFYQGYTKAFSKGLIGGMLYFPLNDYFKEKTDSRTLGAMLAAITAVTITQPVDYLKTRQMAGNQIGYRSLRLMYTGYGLNLFRIVPHFTIVMVTADYLKEIKW